MLCASVLAVDDLEFAEQSNNELFSGDGDFRSLVQAVQRRRRPSHRDFHHREPAADDRRR
ncbi:hypothetical protein CF64_14060 [Bradyrhizobium japonicum]|nr:hypothetical protein CF64_14060 [Bradyrhizobium japonicum]